MPFKTPTIIINMTKLLVFLMPLLSGILLLSCHPKEASLRYENVPLTLTELHKGFYETELSETKLSLEKDTTSIIAFGHTYPLLNYPLVFDAFIETIIKEDADYIFILGDVVKDNSEEEWDYVLSQFERIGKPLFFAPGNHDLNYHYERYNGKHDNQFEAEQRYINKVGYRYKIAGDVNANYVFINMNDSIDRVLQYLNHIKPQLDTTKPALLLTSQCIWHNKHQIKGDHKTWTNKPFRREELLPHIEYYDYLIHGDWGGKFFRGKWNKSNGAFDVIGVGNRKVGDPFFISRLEITTDTIISYGIDLAIPEDSHWFNL